MNGFVVLCFLTVSVRGEGTDLSSGWILEAVDTAPKDTWNRTRHTVHVTFSYVYNFAYVSLWNDQLERIAIHPESYQECSPPVRPIIWEAGISLTMDASLFSPCLSRSDLSLAWFSISVNAFLRMVVCCSVNANTHPTRQAKWLRDGAIIIGSHAETRGARYGAVSSGNGTPNNCVSAKYVTGFFWLRILLIF